MILQALVNYYERIEAAPKEGFEKKEIPFIIELDRNGHFISLHDTRQVDGKKKTVRSFIVPKGVKKSVNIAANLLWGTPQYVLGIPKPDPKKDAEKLQKRAESQNECFLNKIKDTFPAPFFDEGISSVCAFLENKDFNQVLAHNIWPEILDSGANISFRLEGDLCLICERPEVREFISNCQESAAEKTVCLITGEKEPPVRLHTAIKGVRGAQSSGANIVSFNLDAFNSFGKNQGFNSPIGQKSEFAYTTALNILLSKKSNQKLLIGDATTIFWAERKHDFEGAFAQIFGDSPKGEPAQDCKQLIALFRSPVSGARPELNPETMFYILGLAPNASRISVRFWYAGTVGEIVANIQQHFEDLEIDAGNLKWRSLSIRNLLRAIAVKGEDKNVPPKMTGDMMRSILESTLYPRTLITAVVGRCKAEQSKKDPKTGKLVQNVTFPRAALIKACLVREKRYYKKNEKEITMTLDSQNSNPGYLLGRLFATLEKIQEEASPGINATIRDRFYGSASATPASAFPHLMKLKNHHLGKLENRGRAVNLEKIIIDIMVGLTDFPAHLCLHDQGRFAIGYYHQRQDLFTKKDKIRDDITGGNNE